jgi:hypothetical protein
MIPDAEGEGGVPVPTSKHQGTSDVVLARQGKFIFEQNLLPLNRPRGIRRDVIHNAIHAEDFIHDAIRNFLRHFVGERNAVGGRFTF